VIFFIFQTPGDSDNFPLFFVEHKEKKEEDKNEHFQHLVLYWDGMTLAIVRDMSKANGIKSTISNNSDHHHQKMNHGTNNGTTTVTTHNTTNGSSQNGLSDSEVATNGNSAGSKLSKFGRRIRDSCRNLRGKHPSGGASSNPDDYNSSQAPNESSRSQHYVPMDFSGKSGRIVSAKDIAGHSTKEGYTYFRRKIEPQNVDHLLTETQANIHKDQAWFHKGVSRDLAQRILGSHCIDGLFLARESSVQGGFVISYYFGSRVYHVPVMPQTNPTTSAVTYSLDEGKTKFFDLLQCVEFYQLNKGSLNCKLTHYVVSRSGGQSGGSGGSLSARSESPTDSASSYCKNASDVSIDSKEDPNHNSKKSKKMDQDHPGDQLSATNCSNSEDEHSVATAVDANMASEDSEADDSASMKLEEHWKIPKNFMIKESQIFKSNRILIK